MPVSTIILLSTRSPGSLSSPTLLNQSDRSDFVEKSFSSCDCISRAVGKSSVESHVKFDAHSLPARTAFPSCSVNDGFSPNALVPHHVRSCRIRLGSDRPSLAMCL